MLNEQAIAYTYTTTSEQAIADSIADKARNLGVELSPDEIKVQRSPGQMAITVNYTVHVDLPIHPLDLNFKTAANNHNVMK
jgi:hypothetical protein